jgi:hypothetical protein
MQRDHPGTETSIRGHCQYNDRPVQPIVLCAHAFVSVCDGRRDLVLNRTVKVLAIGKDHYGRTVGRI